MQRVGGYVRRRNITNYRMISYDLSISMISVVLGWNAQQVSDVLGLPEV
jgi:hypothetical protein